MKNIDKSAANKISQELEVLVKEFAAARGLAVTLKGGSFTSSSFSPKLEFAIVNETGNAVTKEFSSLKRMLSIYKINDKFLEPINHRGDTIRLIGYRDRAPKKPFLIEVNGKQFVAGTDYVNMIICLYGSATRFGTRGAIT